MNEDLFFMMKVFSIAHDKNKDIVVITGDGVHQDSLVYTAHHLIAMYPHEIVRDGILFDDIMVRFQNIGSFSHTQQLRGVDPRKTLVIEHPDVHKAYDMRAQRNFAYEKMMLNNMLKDLKVID